MFMGASNQNQCKSFFLIFYFIDFKNYTTKISAWNNLFLIFRGFGNVPETSEIVFHSLAPQNQFYSMFQRTELTVMGKAFLIDFIHNLKNLQLNYFFFSCFLKVISMKIKHNVMRDSELNYLYNQYPWNFTEKHMVLVF